MYQNRIQKVRELLAEKQLDAMIVSSVSNIFYLTGISHFSKEEREAYLLITKHNAHFFTTALYMEEVQKQTSEFIYHTIGRDMPFVKLFKQICVDERLTSAGFEEHDIRYFEYYWMHQVLTALTPLSLDIRIIKDTAEIETIQQACNMGDKAFAYVVKQLRTGVTEKEIAVAIELYLKKNDADISFRPIVAFGTNTSMPHHESSHERKLKRNDCVLIDMGAKVDGYCSDMTRTIFFGKPSEEARKIYETVLESQKKAIEYLSSVIASSFESEPEDSSLRVEDQSITSEAISSKVLQTTNHGITSPRSAGLAMTCFAKDVDAVAREYIVTQGYPSIPHSLGHGIGIDVHEPPRLNPTAEVPLAEGMVFSIEPGIYLPAGRQVSYPQGMGVRIEDLVVIKNNTLKILTLSPKELFVL